jgi:myo-inositol 2-dehydrogenase/D-chiro-inositol 1-dehydrogenase
LYIFYFKYLIPAKMERRSFIKNSAIMSAGVMLYPGLNTGANSAAPVRVGIIGCGNRGTAVLTAMSKIAGAQVVAMADLFED